MKRQCARQTKKPKNMWGKPIRSMWHAKDGRKKAANPSGVVSQKVDAAIFGTKSVWFLMLTTFARPGEERSLCCGFAGHSEKKAPYFLKIKWRNWMNSLHFFERKNWCWANKESSSSWGFSECGIWTFARTVKSKVVLACVFNSGSCSVWGQDRIGHWYPYSKDDMLKISSQVHFSEQLQLPSLSQPGWLMRTTRSAASS